ncbi:hypothetical protein [Paenibacillus sp. LPE1-1-1.1]|uniref:hypothetical protein n=1 Tax=Paenibacillus sp. LPE1-1-1.1 TaxID=3135230 RepID=UPI0034372D88
MVVHTSSYPFKYRKAFEPDTQEHSNEFTKLYGPYATPKPALSYLDYEIAYEPAGDGLKILSVDSGGNNTPGKGKCSGIPKNHLSSR